MNCRVKHCDTKNKATVRFLGQINNQEFYGIEYDEAVGKYDGTYEGQQYFSCMPAHGGFVKSKKLLFGTKLFDAIQAKYLLDRSAARLMYLDDGQLLKELEFCGIDQVDKWHREIQRMPTIGFSDGVVSEVGDIARLAQLIPGCQSLDLSDCLLVGPQPLELLKLPNIAELNLSRNRVLLHESGLAIQRELPCRLVLNNVPGQTEQDLNRLLQLPSVTDAEMNGSAISIPNVLTNNHLTSLSLTGSLTFPNVAELISFLSRFPGLQRFTSLDCLCEAFATSQPECSIELQLKQLNLQESALTYGGLLVLRRCAPQLEDVKIMKVFHSAKKTLQSIFQSDQVIPLIGGLFYTTIKRVNAVEVKKKHLSDACMFYVKYACSLPGFQAAGDPWILQICREWKIALPRIACTGLTNDDLIGVEVFEENPDEKESESQRVSKRFHDKLVRFKHKQQMFYVVKSTPIWKLMDILQEKGIESKIMLLEGGRQVKLEDAKIGTLLEEFRECAIDIM